MSPTEGLQKIVKPALAKVLGDLVTNLAMTKAIGALTRTVGGDEKVRFTSALDALCLDPQLQKALGPKRLGELKRDWLAAF
ncbi:MAG: hypothetical protein HY812_21860 [Planctomycetes bacterium]|nr:hypothetical protein [Planctomycetota bacterium]